jgi:hypothetical protein
MSVVVLVVGHSIVGARAGARRAMALGAVVDVPLASLLTVDVAVAWIYKNLFILNNNFISI